MHVMEVVANFVSLAQDIYRKFLFLMWRLIKKEKSICIMKVVANFA